jgi:outer membrane protein OmpA-like peptidoglycan-associated protein
MCRFCVPFLFLFLITTVNAATLYNYPEKPGTKRLSPDQIAREKTAPLQLDTFTAIYRYPSLYQNSAGELDEASKQTFEQIKSQLAKIGTHNIFVTVIGHSQKNYSSREDIYLPTAFTRSWQRLGETIPPEQDSTRGDVDSNMKKIRQLLRDNGIDESRIYLENRNGFDRKFIEYGHNEQTLNRRVDVAIYLIKERDSDGDGVLDHSDRCPDTSQGLVVDSDGCPKILTLYLEFDFDSNQLRNVKDGDTVQQLDQLKKFADLLHKHQEYRAVIIGYTDSTGDEEYNQRLSLRRAEAVKNLLIKEGISEYQIGIDGLGEKYPVASNDTEAGRQKNRRIELKLMTE